MVTLQIPYGRKLSRSLSLAFQGDWQQAMDTVRYGAKAARKRAAAKAASSRRKAPVEANPVERAEIGEAKVIAVDPVFDTSMGVEYLLRHALDGRDNKGVFWPLRSFAESGERPEALAKLKDIEPQNFMMEDSTDLAACLTSIGMCEDAERVLNRKVGVLPGAMSGSDLMPLLEAFAFVRAEQGKFGRKPVDALPLWQFFEANLKSLQNDPRFSAILPHIIAHLSHFRMVKEMRRLSDDVVAGIDRANIPRLVQISNLVVTSIMVPSKRPELRLYNKHRIAIDLQKQVEASATVFYGNKHRHIPGIVRMGLFQMALAVEDLERIERHKSVIFGDEKPITKGERVTFDRTVTAYFSYLARATRYEDARIFLSSQKSRISEERYLSLLSSCYAYERNYSSALSLLDDLLKGSKKNLYRRKIASVYADSGELEKADEWLKSAAHAAIDGSKSEKAAIKGMRARVEFLLRSSEILESVPQPRLPKGVVFLGSSACLNTISIVVPVLVELKRRGYAVIQLDEGMLRNKPTGIDWIDRHSGMVDKVIHSDFNIFDGLKNEWVIDWAGKRVVSDGINFYQGLFEVMTQRLRAFSFDLGDPGVYRWFRHYLVRCDRALSACKSIEKNVMSRGMPVRFINAGSHSAPFSVYRTFALQAASKYDVGFVHMGPAYENYYNNLKGKVATTVCLENLTKYPLYRLPFLARPDLFENWLAQEGLYDRYREDIERVLNHNRVGRIGDGSASSPYEEKLRAAKSSGKKIIGVYGKILCDLAVPFDGGPGHEHIADWLRHTVSIARSTSNLIVLKPHPHELRPEISRDLNEYWLGLVEHMELPDNVVILPHKGFNNQDLIQYLDLAVLWNGTSALELCAQGVPVVMASHFGRHDYPVDLIYPDSREHYEHIICADKWERPDKNKMERAALLLKYMGTDEVCIPFTYSHRQLTNDPVGVPYWHMDEVGKFLRDGDPYISRLADKFFA